MKKIKILNGTKRHIQNMRVLFLLVYTFILLSTITVQPSYAQPPETLPRADFSSMVKTSTAEVLRVVDERTLQLADGRIVQLMAIYVPNDQSTEQTQNPEQTNSALPVLATNILRDMLEGEMVTLYQTPKDNWGRMNRLGHHMAHVVVEDTQSWAQGTLLRLGLALVKTDNRSIEMAEDMYALENIARTTKLGAWGNNTRSVKDASKPDTITAGFQIAQGKIHSVALKMNRIYLNFGDNWKTDFTVSIAPEYKRSFSKAGLDPMSWNGKTVRVRGWVREYNGPYIEITHPQAVEILK